MTEYEAIFRRKSIRSYSSEKLEQVDQIVPWFYEVPMKFCQMEFEPIVVVNEKHMAEKKIFRGMVSKVAHVGAPYYIIFRCEKKKDYLIQTGYMVERVVLKLTASGAATCWIGALFHTNTIDEMYENQRHLENAILVAVGKPLSPLALFRNDNRINAKRKIPEEICLTPVPDWFQPLLEAARVAPSSMNSQPWRFFAGRDSVDVYLREETRPILGAKLKNLNQIDIGIALAHIDIAAEANHISIEMLKKEEPAQILGHSYIMTIKRS